MKQNFIQIIEDCLAKHKNTPKIVRAPIGVFSAMNVTVFPQELAFNDLLKQYPDSIEIKYAIAKYHKEVRRTDTHLDTFNKENPQTKNEEGEDIKDKIGKLISKYCNS